MTSAAEQGRDGTLTSAGAKMLAFLFGNHPPARREALVEEVRAGQQDRAAGRVRVKDPDADAATELMLAERQRLRALALADALPDGRAVAALRGLACLEPADQHPGDLAQWLADPDQLTLILAGKTGAGKTMAAYAVAAEAAVGSGAAMQTRTDHVEVRQLVVRAWTVNGYLAELRPEGSPEPVWQIRNRARWAELLILDDLGAETDGETKEFVRKELVELLSYRLDKRFRTVFTTNLRSPQVGELFGPRLMSRLADRSTALPFTGGDRRNLRKLSW